MPKPKDTDPTTAKSDCFEKAIAAAKKKFQEIKKEGTFTSLKCAAVAKAALLAVTDKDGEPVDFTDNEQKAWLAAFNATVENRVAILTVVLANHEIEPDQTFLGLMKQFFSATAVQNKIETAANQPTLRIQDLLE